MGGECLSCPGRYRTAVRFFAALYIRGVVGTEIINYSVRQYN